MNTALMDTLICGNLAQETIINLDKEIYINEIGGNLLYTAYSHNIWRNGAGLAANVGENFSEDWLSEIEENQFNVQGIHRKPTNLDMRAFYVQISEDEYRTENPQKHFAQLEHAFPKSLLGYTAPTQALDNRKTGTAFSLRVEDIPSQFRQTPFVYLCPMDFFTHSLIPPLFRSASASMVFINPPASYMHASFYFDIGAVLRGSSVVITTMQRARALFLGRSKEIWEMAETIASFGVEVVVITDGKNGQYLYENANKKKYHLPAYPVKAIDTICANDAFGGGFLAGYVMHFDPKLATMMGNISASIKVQGSTPDYLLHTLPDLAQARLESIQDQMFEC